jgi:protein dithiol oxidoreductase (disulfide-forming)
MRRRRWGPLLGLTLALPLALTACGRQDSANGGAPAKSPGLTRAAAKPASSPKLAMEKSPADTVKPLTINHLNEDGSETVEEATGDSGAHNPLLAAVAATVAAATPTAMAAPLAGPTMWQEGVNYTRLVPAQPTSVAAGQVEVLEFFWYACPHCYALEPQVQAWEKSKPAFVSFSRVHVEWNEGHRSLARLYYTLESMGKLSQYHAEVFKEIHVNGDPLIGADPENTAQAERVQLAFIKKLGIPEADFERAYHSFDVDQKMQRADELVQRYRITGVPAFIVNGKFGVDVASAGSPERLMSLVGDLAAQEHKR